MHLVVVQRGDLALYARLTARPWEGVVTVVWDRRHDERRTTTRPVPVDSAPAGSAAAAAGNVGRVGLPRGAASGRAPVTPPIWLDAPGRPRPTQACWICGREVATMRFCAADLRPHGWAPPQTLHIPDWCGCTTEYLPVPVGDGWWQLVPIWAPDQVANPLQRYGPPEPR